MAYSNETNKLKLPLYSGGDKWDYQDFNAAFNKIDPSLSGSKKRTMVLSGIGVPGFPAGGGRSNNIAATTAFYIPVSLWAGAKITKVTVKFASDRTVSYVVGLYKEGSLYAAGSTEKISDKTQTGPNDIIAMTTNYTIESNYAVIVRIGVTVSGGSYCYVYPPEIEFEMEA